MKMFAIPEAEIIRFVKKDVIATSTCKCVECTTCTSGDDCECNDLCHSKNDGTNQCYDLE